MRHHHVPDPPPTNLGLQEPRAQIAATRFEIVQIGPTGVAIVALDGEPKHLVLPNTTRVFWKTISKIDVEHIDVATEVRVAKQQLDKLDPARSPMVADALVDCQRADTPSGR